MWVEVLRSNDLVELSWALAVLKADGLTAHVADAHASAIEGSIGALPRRLMIGEDDLTRARWALERARAALEANDPPRDEG